MSDRSSKQDDRNKRAGSGLSGLNRCDVAERRRRIEKALGLDAGTLDSIDTGLSVEAAEVMVENVIGLFQLPLAVATNFVIDGVERLVPMVVEESSVIAAASNGAKMVRAGGGFVTSATDPITIAQVELRDVLDMDTAVSRIESASTDLAAECDDLCRDLVVFGGGFRDFELRPLGDGATLVCHLLVDCRDAMGANIVNTLAEAIAPRLAELSGGTVGLRIVSNLADRRIATAECQIPSSALGRRDTKGTDVRDGIVAATRFADFDPYRAATHNKGVMNGVDAVVVATANDWRAVEAGAHAYAARTGRYRPLTDWSVGSDGALIGRLELPLSVGIVGGATRTHPVAQLACEILGVRSASDLARVAAAVGLAQNLAALAALAAEGIQQGHMALHSRSHSERTGSNTKEG